MKIIIDPILAAKIPSFKIGVLHYQDIVVGDSPQMLKGRLQLFQEELMISLKEKTVSSISGIEEWRSIFKEVGTDPSRYRPSVEALYKKIQKGQWLPSINSAVDLNNFFSVKYEIPIGIYDAAFLTDPVTVRIGTEQDSYIGINGRENQMTGKLLTSDKTRPFGSPIVDSKETVVSENTTTALQIVYLQHTMSSNEAGAMLAAIEKMFLQVHGGTCTSYIIEACQN